jgi:DNA-nicking Smr family endonuclease
LSDEERFQQMLGDDVVPIIVPARVAINKDKERDIDKHNRRLAAMEINVSQEDPLSSSPVVMVEPMALLTFRRPGVQHGVFKKLRLGKYTLDACLDLHRLNVEAARKAVYEFVCDCVNHDVRAALITHGKGEGREKPAMLKSCVAHWLPQIDSVLAFHTAQKQHGSYGATYIMLKKSDQKKIENKEKN